MLSKKGFNDWASNYDKQLSPSKGYPFEGYNEVILFVQSFIKISKNTKILDIGIGTGKLSKSLYEKNAKIYGVDFSKKMINIAKSKMPNGIFEVFDFKNGLPERFQKNKFDFIISSYALHHLNDVEKVNLLNNCKSLIKYTGAIIIADIAFKNKIDLKSCREKYVDVWDDSEYYFKADEFANSLGSKFNDVSYSQISECAGVFVIE
jgi:putative AdoMet-dependent methyltransferase